MISQIRIEDLFLIYGGDFEKVVAVRGLHLEISAGECLVIHGPNGSGKSTLVKLLTGYLTPTAGSIFLDGKNIKDFDPIQLRRDYIASVDQRGNLIEELTMLENLSLGYRLKNSSSATIEENSVNLLRKYGLEGIAKKYPAQISAGERQILSLLAALATQPQILIADEPSAELDDALAATVYALLKSLAGKTTVVLVTHDPRAEQCADRIVRIQEGRISESWSPGQPEGSVTDPFGWMRVSEISTVVPKRSPYEHKADARPLLQVQNVEIEYQRKKLFAGVSFEARAGELVAVDSSISSGFGKSSLLKVLAGIMDPSSGSIRIGGNEIGLLDRTDRAKLRHLQIGYLDQRSNALENISLKDFYSGFVVPHDQIFLNRVNQSLNKFSGGERAYIELSKLLLEAKPILLLDEPTSQMDEKRTLASIVKLFEYVRTGGLAILVTRDRNILEAADLVIGLEQPISSIK